MPYVFCKSNCFGCKSDLVHLCTWQTYECLKCVRQRNGGISIHWRHFHAIAEDQKFQTKISSCGLLMFQLNQITQSLVRCSTCPLVFECCKLSYVIFLKLRKKELLAKLSKFTKWQLFSLKMVLGCRFEWKQFSFCEFAQLCKQLFPSLLKINCVIQYLKAKS